MADVILKVASFPAALNSNSLLNRATERRGGGGNGGSGTTVHVTGSKLIWKGVIIAFNISN